jgi:hypothetical protein
MTRIAPHGCDASPALFDFCVLFEWLSTDFGDLGRVGWRFSIFRRMSGQLVGVEVEEAVVALRAALDRLGYGRSRRIATASQRRALAGRMAHPDARRPAQGHPTTLDRPRIDPTQTPTRNTMHDTALDPVPAA